MRGSIMYKVMKAGDYNIGEDNFDAIFPGTKFESVGMGVRWA